MQIMVVMIMSPQQGQRLVAGRPIEWDDLQSFMANVIWGREGREWEREGGGGDGGSKK